MLGTWNDHNLAAFLGHCADDIVLHDVAMSEPSRGKGAVGEYLQSWMTAFPDLVVQRDQPGHG